jgi:viologen exporter family transport system ATP-binding protein
VPIISVRDLVKEFRTPKRAPGLVGAIRTLFTTEQRVTRAVDGVSLDVEEGELVGYLGRNGAGKSTTIKCLTGILVPTSGQVVVDGVVPWRDRQRNALNIGVVFGQRSQLWWDIPLVDSLELIGRMYRLDRPTYRRNLETLAALLGLEPFLDKSVRQLSLGQKMRGDLAAAMLYEPRILYLDEPTVGLDVLAKERIRSFIVEMNRTRGTTVLLTTHDLKDVELLCRRIVLIELGRVLYDGTVAELKRRYAPFRELVITLAVEGAEVDLPGAERVRQEGPQAWLRFDPERVPVADLIVAATARYPVRDIAIEETDLETVVRQIFAEREEPR